MNNSVQIQIEGADASQKQRAEAFLKLIALDPVRESDFDDVPLQQIFKPVFGVCFKGQLQRALEFRHNVLIEGLENQNHNVRIVSPNADDRLELLQFILQIEDLTDKATDIQDTKGVGAKLRRFLKQIGEPVREQAMVETLTVKMKEVILEIIDGSKININQVRKANSIPPEPSEVWVF